MVYKKYILKGGKRVGPYYYESYREGDSVRKRYIGGEKEYQTWLNKNKKDRKNVEQFIVVSKKTFNIGILLFLLSLIVLIFVIGWNFGSFTRIIPFSFTGFVISENASDSISNEALLYGSYEDEIVVEQFDKNNIDLEIKEPPKFAGEAVSENKNKRMEFNTSDGNIRLYFDLLNYSEFVDEINSLVEEDKIQEAEANKVKEQESEIYVPAEEVTEPISEISNETIEVIEEPNTTQETPAETPAEEIIEPTEQPVTETPVEEPSSEPALEAPITGGVVAVEKGNGFLFKVFKYPVGFFIKVFEKIGITGRAVDDTNISEAEITTEETQTIAENNSDNLADNVNDNLINEEVVSEESSESSIVNTETSTTISATTTEEIQDKVEELDDNEIKTIETQAKVVAGEFEVNVTTADENKYKWGYKVKLNSLNFMAKIDITSEKNISVYNEDTLQIGNQLLSFNDLVKAGYTVRIEKPALEINISTDAGSAETNTETETISDNLNINNTENISNGGVNSEENVSSEEVSCYDDKTEILTLNENGGEEWKLFSELNDNDEVATFNDKTGELEYQKPIEYQEFNYSDNMYKIVLEDDSTLLVSEEHRVYVKNDKLINKKENATKNVASKVMQIFTDYNIYRDNTYINFSVYDNNAEVAPVASMVMHQSEKLGLHGRPGSIPGWSASAFDISNENIDNFNLVRISNIYNEINLGEISAGDLVFLNENLNEIKVKSITKVPYSGKIYDVDVENDIVLVRRNSEGKLGRAVWSGNSNNGEQEVVTEPISETPVEEPAPTGITGNIIKSFSRAFYAFAGLTGGMTGRVVDENNEFAIEQTEIANVEYANTITIYIEKDFNPADETINTETQTVQETSLSDNLDINNNENNLSESSSEVSEISNSITGNVISDETITANNNIATENSLPADNSDGINNINSGSESLVGVSDGEVSEINSELNDLSNVEYEDIDGDGKISVGDIIVLDPTLTYIYATNAEHLDANRGYISDIYESVKEQDGNWSEVINNNEFVRVTFEKNLTNLNDITFYGRVVNYSCTNETLEAFDELSNETINSSIETCVGEKAEIEVYRKDDNISIAKFENVSTEGWYKIYLTNLSDNETRDVFDLRILGAEGNLSSGFSGVEFDYIVDPVNLTYGTNLGASYITNGNNVTITANASTDVEGGNVSTFINWDNSLVSWWRMDDTNSSGDPTDYLGIKNGTKAGNANQTASGYMGKGFIFDGVDDNVDVSGMPNDNYTMSFWINAQTPVARSIFWSPLTASYPYLSVETSGKLFVRYSSGDYSLSTSTITGGWKHIVVYVNGTGGATGTSIYVNAGAKEGGQSGASAAPFSFSVTNYRMGRDNNGNNDFNGTLDDVMIFNRSLSAHEIQMLYANTSSKFLNQTYIMSSERNYSFTAYAQDTAGSVNSSGAIVITRDITNPTLNITYPQNTTHTNYVTALNYTISETGGSCWYSINSGVFNYTSVSAGTNWTNLNGNSSKGSNTWTLWCNDSAGNLNSTSVSFVVDNTAPTQTITSPTNTTYTSASVNFNVSSSESGTGSIIPNLDSSLVSWWRMDDTNGSSNSVTDYMGRNNGTASGNAVSTDAGYFGKGEGFDGSNSKILITTDANNFNLTKMSGVTFSAWVKPNTFNFNTDIGGYIIEQGEIIHYFYVQNATGKLVGCLTDSSYNCLGAGPLVSTNAINTNQWTYVAFVWNGSNYYIYSNGLANGNAVASGTPFYRSGGSYPLVIGGRYSSNTRLFNGTIDDVMIFNRSLSADEITALYNATAINHNSTLSEGSHTLTAYSQDRAGNVNNSAVSFSVDTTAPTLNITYPTNTTYTNYVTALNYTTNADGSCWYSINGGTFNYSSVNAGINWSGLNGNSTKGSNTWTLWCNDTAGNLNSTSVTFTVDNTSPTQTINSPTNTTYTSASVNFNISSSESGTGSLVPNLDNGLVSWWRMDDTNGSANSVTDYMGRNNGTAVGNAVQTDAGKMGKGEGFDGSGDYIKSTTALNPDSNNYSIAIWVNRANVGGTALIHKDGNAVGYAIRFTGSNSLQSLVYIGGVLYTTSAATSAITNNNWAHVVLVIDRRSNISIYVNGTLSGTPTNISAATGMINGTAVFNIGYSNGWISGTDFNGTIDDVMIFNKSLTSDEILALYNATAISHNSTLTDGSHSLTAYSQDRAGNVNNSAVTFTLSLDSTAPNVTINFPANTTYGTGSVMNFSVNATDASGMSACWYTLNSGVTNYTMTNTTALSIYNYTNSSIADGSYTAKFYCNDTNNNVNGSMSVGFSIDTTFPTLNIVYPVNGTIYSINVSAINYTSSGASNCWYSTNGGTTNSSSVSAGTNFTGLSGVNDKNNWTLYCNDSAGNTNSSLVIFYSTYISACGSLTQAGQTYTLQNNVSSMGTCFNITADNITIDCVNWNNKIVYGDQNSALVYAGIYSDKLNTTIKNCELTRGRQYALVSQTRYGIYFVGSNYSKIENVNVSNNYLGIYLSSSTNNNLTGIIANSNTDGSANGDGINLLASSNNTFNNITASSNNRAGIFSSSNSNYNNFTGINAHFSDYDFLMQSGLNYFNNIVTDLFYLQSSLNNLNNITASGLNLNSASNNNITNINLSNCAGNCLSFNDESNNNNITQGVIKNSSSSLIAFSSSLSFSVKNNTIKDINLIGPYTYSIISSHGGPQQGGIESNNILINVTQGNESVGSTGQLIRKWYYQTKVNDTAGNPVVANVSATNSSGSVEFSVMTNSSGWMNASQIITDYVNTAGTKTYYNSVVSAVNSTYMTTNSSYNATLNNNKLNDNIQMSLSSSLTTCGLLDVANTVYTLQNSITTTGSCFNITADNITLNGNGYTIDGDDSGTTDYGIYASGRNNITIRNFMNITDFYNGIHLTSTNNSVIQNITANSNIYCGIYSPLSSNNNFSSITANSNSYAGIYLLSSSKNNQLTNITANSNSNGIWVYTSSNNNQFSNIIVNSNTEYGIYLKMVLNNTFNNFSVWNSSTSGSYTGIYVDESSNNSFISGYVNKSGNYGIWFRSVSGPVASNNLFKDMWINETTSSDVYVQTSGAGSDIINNTFLNVSYSDAEGSSLSTGIMEIIRKWYYQAKVNDTAGNPVVANVSATNSSGSVEFSVMTNSSGWMNASQIITDYVNTAGTKTYYNSVVSAVNSTYMTTNSTYNATLNNNKLNDNIQMSLSSSLTTCGLLDVANTVYTLQNNITTTGTCFNITASNITLNGNGYTIDGDDSGTTDYGIYASGRNNITIRNFANITDFYNGIYLSSTNNSVIQNITANSNAYVGIYLLSSSNNNLTQVTESGGDIGISLSSSSNNTLTSITANSNSGPIWGYGIYSISSSNNTLTSITANSNGVMGIYLESSSNNNLVDGNIGSSGSQDIRLILSTNINVTNVSYSTESVDATASLIRKWYYTAYVNDTLGANVSNANITAYNQTGSYAFNLTTGSDGLTTSSAQIIDYVNNAGTKTYYSPYNVYAGNITYPTLNNSWNVTAQQNTRQTITLDKVYPLISYSDGTLNDSSRVWNTNVYVNVSATETNFKNITFKLYYSNNTAVNTTTYTTVDASSAYNINWTSLAGDDYKYNITICDLGSLCNTTTTRAITLITSQENISLNSGWNLISLPMKNTDSGTDRNISLVAGWNLIGYTGDINLSLADAVFNNGSNSYTWAQALTNNKVQAYLAYYDNNVQDNLTQFKYLSTISDMDDTMFRAGKGYWMYSNQSGVLTIPGIGGTTIGQSYDVSKLRFFNGSLELNYSEASSASYQWVLGTPKRYGLVDSDPIFGDSYGFIDLVAGNSFSSLEGYFIYGYKDNLTLIRAN